MRNCNLIQRASFVVLLSLVSLLSIQPVASADENPARTLLPRAILVRQDRLPDLAGPVESYRIGYLPASEERFVLFGSNLFETLVEEYGSGNLWVNSWGKSPLGKPVDRRWFNGAISVITRSDRSAAAMMMLAPRAQGDPEKKVALIFRGLDLVASFDLEQYPLADLVGISSYGKVVCRLGQTKRALFLSPGAQPSVREFPATFLNWDFARSRAILGDGTRLRALQGDKTIYDIAFPFVVDRAHVFDDGAVMAGSRNVGGHDYDPCWRISVDANGKQQGEGLIGEWMKFPHEYFPKSSTRRPSEYIAAVSDGKFIRYSIKGLIPYGEKIPASNAFHEHNLLDSRGNIYTLTTERFPVQGADEYREEHRVVLSGVNPTTLVNSQEIGKVLGIDEPWIYTMDVSLDGNWLGMTVTDSYHAYEHWWLLQYKIEHPVLVEF